MPSALPRAQRIALLLSLAVTAAACGDRDGGSPAPTFVPGEVAVIPRPEQTWVDAGGARFVVTTDTPVLVEGGNASGEDAAVLLVELLRNAFPDFSEHTTHGPGVDARGAILLTSSDADPALGDEGYELDVNADGVVVRAGGARGLLYGVQTLRQLLPAEVESADAAQQRNDWTLPSVRVVDRPRFSWRGLMLDSSRFFLPVDYVLRTIDRMALHKLNVLHFHLSDDQGWRIESERHPELHEIGSVWDAELAPDERGGYYTRAELAEIVAHARRRGIEVVPEVDMPGHTVAILRALPELACTTSPDVVRTRDQFRITRWFEGPMIHEEVLCACDERVYAFVADLLDELVAIFPSPWIHLGGDETPTAEWATSHLCAALADAGVIDGPEEVQAYFSHRVEELVRARGKRLIGWSEVLRHERASGGRFALSDAFTTMHWNAIFEGDPPGLYDRDVILTPVFTLYLDWYSSSSLEQVYAYEPVPAGLTAEQAAHVLGAQGSMWTGFPQQRSLERIDVHLFPKLLAIGELTWSAPERRDFADFEARRAPHELRLDLLGVTRGPCTDCRF